jgi:hypothetical protein
MEFSQLQSSVDGKDVILQAPANSGSPYSNYKKTVSVLLLAVFDASYKFVMVNVGSHVKNGDTGIFAHSNMARYLEDSVRRSLSGTNKSLSLIIIGDEPLPLHTPTFALQCIL